MRFTVALTMLAMGIPTAGAAQSWPAPIVQITAAGSQLAEPGPRQRDQGWQPGTMGRTYTFSVTNWNAYPESMFGAADCSAFPQGQVPNDDECRQTWVWVHSGEMPHEILVPRSASELASFEAMILESSNGQTGFADEVHVSLIYWGPVIDPQAQPQVLRSYPLNLPQLRADLDNIDNDWLARQRGLQEQQAEDDRFVSETYRYRLTVTAVSCLGEGSGEINLFSSDGSEYRGRLSVRPTGGSARDMWNTNGRIQRMGEGQVNPIGTVYEFEVLATEVNANDATISFYGQVIEEDDLRNNELVLRNGPFSLSGVPSNGQPVWGSVDFAGGGDYLRFHYEIVRLP